MDRRALITGAAAGLLLPGVAAAQFSSPGSRPRAGVSRANRLYAGQTYGPLYNPPQAGIFTGSINGGSGTISIGNDADGKCTLNLGSPPGSGDNIRGYHYAMGGSSSNWTLTARIIGFNRSTNFPLIGIYLRESSSGKLITHGTSNRTAAGVNQNIQADRWTSPTAFSAVEVTQVPFPKVEWFRTVDDGTNHIYYISPDGTDWYRWGSAARTAFITADQIGFFGNLSGGSYPSGWTQLVSCTYWSFTYP